MFAEPTFGTLAKDRRRELGLTQDELARRVGCAPITIRKIEADDLRPSVQIAERMAMALNIPLEERAAFVKLARTERTPFEEPKVTPMPAFEEIGSEDLSGRAIRGYALGERLGNGGMGVVYRAVQPLVEREVAIKIILPQYANHPDFIRRFEAEAQLVARLEHPHIVPLYDYWREPSVAYLIMRLLRGGSVQSLLRNGIALTPEAVLRMMEQIGSALSSAHRAGIVHRDLKPANVLLDEDNNAYLADFGIAKNLSSPSSDTQADVVIGSPDYISPEQIKSEFVRPQTDIYALGVMLYELLTGRVPFHGPTPFEVMHQHLSTPLPVLAANRSGLPKALDAVIGRATEKDPLQRYETVDAMVDDLRKALGLNLREIKSNAVTSQPTAIPLTPMDNPYKGLRAFGEGDAQDFYGRESLTQQLLVRLGEGGELARFLAVVGPSGSGKSSVVKAGLIPALRRGALPGSENWFIVEMLPGSHPLEELEAALLRVAVNPPASLMEQFQKDSRGLIRAVRRSLPNDPNIELVLVIDQFEEVFTLLRDENERLQFLGLLVSAMLDENSRVRVVLTLRADFIDRPLNYVDFGELLHQRMELVLPLTPDELESAITAPAERVGLHFETGLVSAILHDLGDQPGTLPLLQYALTELYEKRAGNTLTKSAYREIGGVLGALGRRAEDIFTELDGEAQTLAKQLFLRLVTLGEGVEDTRRRALIAELENLQLDQSVDSKNYSKSFQKVLDSFGKARLLSFDRDPDTRGSTVEVAHEAIIREWTRLREWLNESRTLVRMQRQLAQAAAEWENAQHDESFLLTGTKLAQYEGWTMGSAVALTQLELDYLNASVIARDQRMKEETARQQREFESVRKLAETESSRAELQTRSAKQLRQRAVFLTGALVLAMVAAIIAGVIGNRNSKLAIQNEAIASTAQAVEALAIQERDHAENEKNLATSRELAAASLSNLDIDPERSILLALQAEDVAHTIEAENALHSSILASHILFKIFHNREVMGLAYSPDGKHIATADFDRGANIWDANTGKLLLILRVEGGATGIVYSPDGMLIATPSPFSTAMIWNAATGEQVAKLSGHRGWINNVAFSPDGKRLVTASNDRTAKVWDVSTGKELITFSAHMEDVYDVAFSPDGKSIASSGGDGKVRVWDSISGKEYLNLSVDGATKIVGVAFNPDRKSLTAVSDSDTEYIKEWDYVSGKVLFAGNLEHTNTVRDIVFSLDGTIAATGGFDKKVKVWDVRTKKILYTFSGHTENIAGVAINPDGTRVASASYDGTVRVWDLAHPKEFLFIPFINTDRSTWYWAVNYSADGKRILTDYTDSNVRVWDAISGKELLQLIGNNANNQPTAYSSDGKLIASGNKDNTITVWDAQTGKQLANLAGHKEQNNRLAFSPDGTHIASACSDGTVIVWDFISDKVLFKLNASNYVATSVAYSPDGKSLVAGSNEHDAIVWDALTGKKIFTLRFVAVLSVAYSPDGKYIALGGFNGDISIWDASTGKLLNRFKTQTSALLYDIKFSPDGKLIATATSDGFVSIWDIASSANLLTLPVDSDGVGGVSFSPDGKKFAVGGRLGIYIFYLNIQDVISLAKSRVTRTLTLEECQKYLHVDACPTVP